MLLSALIKIQQRSRRSNRHGLLSGFTLIEIIVTIVFLSIAMVSVLSAYTQAMKVSADPMIQIRAIELGQSYMDEIINKKFDENSAQGGIPRCGSSDTGQIACTLAASFGADSETRSIFDDVDDYHNLNDYPPEDSLGVARTGYTNYRVQVTVSFAGSELSSLNTADAKRVDIVVTTPKGDTFNFSSYRVNF